MYWLCMYIIITSAKIIQLNVHIFRQRVTHDCSSTLDSNTTLRELHVPMFFLTVHPYMHHYSLTLGAHAQEGYGTCPVCLSVCLFVCLSVRYHLIVDIVRFYGLTKVCTVLF